jgi:hypothetical protein
MKRRWTLFSKTQRTIHAQLTTTDTVSLRWPAHSSQRGERWGGGEEGKEPSGPYRQWSASRMGEIIRRWRGITFTCYGRSVPIPKGAIFSSTQRHWSQLTRPFGSALSSLLASWCNWCNSQAAYSVTEFKSLEILGYHPHMNYASLLRHCVT